MLFTLLIIQRTGNPLLFIQVVLLLANIIVLFFINTEILLTIFQIFFSSFCMVESWEKLAHSFSERKLNNEITYLEIKKKTDSGASYLVLWCRIILYNNFWDIFLLRITCDWKLWPKFIPNYLKQATGNCKWYGLILAHKCTT